MPKDHDSFENLLEMIRRLPRADQIRLFEAVGLAVGRPSDEERPAPEAGSEYYCGACGTMMPADDEPERCPRCGAPRDQFVLEAED